MPVNIYTTLTDPFAAGNITEAFGINNTGEIVGDYFNVIGTHGFLLSGGTYTTLDDPLATGGITVAQGINASGQIVGGPLSFLKRNQASFAFRNPNDRRVGCLHWPPATFQSLHRQSRRWRICGQGFGCAHQQHGRRFGSTETANLPYPSWVSAKHLHRYVSEATWRFNRRVLKEVPRFAEFLARIDGRLTYKALIAK
jgi:hypothetical protein